MVKSIVAGQKPARRVPDPNTSGSLAFSSWPSRPSSVGFPMAAIGFTSTQPLKPLQKEIQWLDFPKLHREVCLEMGYIWAMAGSPSLNCTITTAISHTIWLFDPINNGYSPTMGYGFLGNMTTWGTSAMVEISWFNSQWFMVKSTAGKVRSSMVLWGHHHGGPMPRPRCPRRPG